MNICKVDTCTEESYGKGLCKQHYMRLWKYGDPLYVPPQKISICKIDGCNRRMRGLGFCSLHYRRYKTYGDPYYTQNSRHGKSSTPIYQIWRGMKKRCFDKNNKDYKRYGGRGIVVCQRWLTFINFYDDMGERPSGYQIDRRNNDGNYEPNNCRWVTSQQNIDNRGPVINGRKLNPIKVREIRSLYPKYSQTVIAVKYNIHQSVVSAIIRRKLWKHVT